MRSVVDNPESAHPARADRQFGVVIAESSRASPATLPVPAKRPDLRRSDIRLRTSRAVFMSSALFGSIGVGLLGAFRSGHDERHEPGKKRTGLGGIGQMTPPRSDLTWVQQTLGLRGG